MGIDGHSCNCRHLINITLPQAQEGAFEARCGCVNWTNLTIGEGVDREPFNIETVVPLNAANDQVITFERSAALLGLLLGNKAVNVEGKWRMGGV